MSELKKINFITEEQAINICNRFEDNFFDLKSSRAKSSVIEDVAVAFANSEGGEIIIGIEDAKGDNQSPLSRWKGLENIEKYNETIHALIRLTPVLDFDYWFLTITGSYGNYILCLKINTSHHVHETSSKEVLVRENAGNIKYKSSRLQSLYFSKGIHSFEDEYIDINIEEIAESKLTQEYISDLNLTNNENIAFLLKERLINENDWKPTVASIILFSDNCTSILPQTALKVIRYQSIDGDELRDELISTKLFEGNIFKILNDSFNYIKLLLADIKIWTLQGETNPNYPEEAIWEILVNCLIHRDYSIQDVVKVKIFDNQISFSSPGKLPSIININNILDNRFSRNPKLVRLLSKSKQAPNKELGEGLNTATEKMVKFGLKKPIFSEENNQFVANLYYVSNLSSDDIVKSLKVILPNGFNRLHARHLFGLDASSTSQELQKLKDKKIIQYNSSEKLWKYLM